MAHEIATRKDGKAAMAYVGETPWHGLGQDLTKGASVDVWKKEAGMDWVALAGTPTVMVEGQAVQFQDHKALYRSDTRKPIAIVGANYQVVQPGECLEFFRDLAEAGGWYIHTAGVLREGRRVWAMATNEQGDVVGKGDPIRNHLLMATSLDGSLRTTVTETSVRVVCANTLAIALDHRSRGRTIKVSHRSEWDPQQVLKSLGFRADSFKLFMERAKHLADTPVKMDEARAILAKVFKLDEKPKLDLSWMTGPAGLTSEKTEVEEVGSKGLRTVLALFDGAGMGADLKTAKGTRWGLLNAVTEYVDHHMGRTQDTRLDNAWFGRGQEIKDLAMATLSDGI